MTGGEKGLHGVTKDYRNVFLTRTFPDTFSWSHGVTRVYRVYQGVTASYKLFQGVTRGLRDLFCFYFI